MIFSTQDYSVRAQSLEALIPLYENDNIARELQLFTQKYKDRLISLTCDKRPFNQVIAIKLVTVMFRSYRDLFTREDVYMVFRMVLNSNRRVAVTAGEFLNDVIERVDKENNSGSLKRAGFNVRWLRYIVTSFIKLGHLDLVPYLVDALIAKFEIIKDWKIIIHILKQTDDLLTPIEQEVLTEMMLWSARLATTGEYPWDRAIDNMVPSLEEIKQMKGDKLNMTKHLMPVIPNLLAQFKSNVNCTINLMGIPQYFDLETYTSEMEDLHLKKLLSALEDIVRETTNANLLRKCSKTLHCLYKRASIAAECDAVGFTILKECAYIYMEPSITWQSIVDGQMDPKDVNKEDYLLIVNCLKKIAIFYSLHNINYLNICDDLLNEFQVYRDGVIQRNLPIEGSIYCLISYGAYLSWELKALKELNDDVVLDCMARAKVLKLKLKEYFEICKDIVQNVIYDDLHKAALTSICELSANFNRELRNHRNQIIHDLVLNLSLDDIALINKYTEEYVFIKHWKGKHEENESQVNKCREVLECYSKLIDFNIIPSANAEFILKYCVKCEKCYGNIIKKIVTIMCRLNRRNCTLTMFLILSKIYVEVERSLGKDYVLDNNVEEFAELKTLAARLAELLGTNELENRHAVGMLHKDGILFAVGQSTRPNEPPDQIPFLAVLSKFSKKLNEEDRNSVYQFLQTKLKTCLPSTIPPGYMWAPYKIYRRSLIGIKPLPQTSETPQNMEEWSEEPIWESSEDAADETIPATTFQSSVNIEQPGRESSLRYSEDAAAGEVLSRRTPPGRPEIIEEPLGTEPKRRRLGGFSDSGIEVSMQNPNESEV
ncbi:cohesin subunit SA-2-like [Ctenocephalides felis]|uniref:cohesin subunit SA-2-like n=1 Tax=Ctenocephalides felis TaxID=7515 RepID=UPI000E6E4945|nr:cohesin subunit SA-2-like [Ctenocephalides felis]